ncbi:carboxypeptidase-like regulatory domain-containing protein [Dysgonomonas sp. Marseille-P4361]|uniref:carboxypeptidase-like regulatory domain-containing protein n=1 Tax=Dysgonomonas sp. Marseille-P4361 TaxID=2161820 RepID=UPI000D5502DC|nr:carboxypeptidase-like regulatory domain-containing protein [Dysgonomonas sp. Marseille-P4361]
MKKLSLFCLFTLFISGLTAQTSIRGVVLDKDTRKPIPDVIVQYGDLSNEYVSTDDNGNFVIPENNSTVIHFQCFGYKTRSVSKENLGVSNLVFMELNPVSLAPVTISPDEADKILKEVMINTKKKLVVEIPLAYLLHFDQTKLSDTLKNEIYLSYTTLLKSKELKKKLKKDKVPYEYNILDVRRLQHAVIPPTELYGAEYHASHLFSFGKSANNETKRSYTSDSSLIILEIKPLPGKKGWAEGEVIINKKDMTLMSIEVASVDSLMEAQPYKKYLERKVKVLRKIGRFEFAETHGKCYMKNCYTYYKFGMYDDLGREDEIVYHCDVNFTGFVKPDRIRKRTLSGFCQELFYLPDSTTKDFWLEEPDENVYIRDNDELDQAFLNSTYAKHKKMSNIIKAAIPPVALFGLFIVLFR